MRTVALANFGRIHLAGIVGVVLLLGTGDAGWADERNPFPTGVPANQSCSCSCCACTHPATRWKSGANVHLQRERDFVEEIAGVDGPIHHVFTNETSAGNALTTGTWKPYPNSVGVFGTKYARVYYSPNCVGCCGSDNKCDGGTYTSFLSLWWHATGVLGTTSGSSSETTTIGVSFTGPTVGVSDGETSGASSSVVWTQLPIGKDALKRSKCTKCCTEPLACGGGAGGGPGAPLPPTGGAGPTAVREPAEPAAGVTLVSPQPGMMLALVNVTPDKTIRLFDPQTGNQPVTEIRVTKDDDGKVVPYTIGGVVLASAGLLLDFGGGGNGGNGVTPLPRGGDGDPVVREGMVILDTKDTITIMPDGTTPPLTVQSEQLGEWADTVLETRTADGNTVWNYPVRKLAEVVDMNGRVVGQTIQYQLNPDEIQADKHALVMVERRGKELARKEVGAARYTLMSIEVVPHDGLPGSSATLQIVAAGLMDYYRRSIWGGVPPNGMVMIDYSRSGGATGPTSTPLAENISLPIQRGQKGGEISARLVFTEGK